MHFVLYTAIPFAYFPENIIKDLGAVFSDLSVIFNVIYCVHLFFVMQCESVYVLHCVLGMRSTRFQLFEANEDQDQAKQF